MLKLRLFLAVLLLSMPGFAQAEDIIGRIKQVDGIAYIQRGYSRVLCKPGLALREGDIVRTLENTNMGLTLVDETSLALGPDTLLKVDAYIFDSLTYDGNLEVSLEQGLLAVRTGRLGGSGEKIKVKTDQSVLGVRGTFFAVKS